MNDGKLQIRAKELLQCRDVLQCIFDLNPLEIDIYRLLNRQGPLSASDIAEKAGKDRSTAYRGLRRLQACGVVFKTTKNLEGGGYKHIYHVIRPEKVEEEMESCLSDWYNKMLTAVKRFPNDLETSLKQEKFG